ncbi:MAG: hypothetical protein A3D47_00085 [Candidatus Colwellbacteria bacterium RIFCSPHIGHO2_02_FULL_43_15]|uniref:Membrane fusion protein biotin-lipoyl like domain-containing protein n=2 Tax=Candidatus Colwelliibacteriota TaxID=1817904 RepID=A0A1G1Z1L8_9BACT|nr:MAG: hypothetical protein A3D47_00085 [Candidatus Colwellbacteria bacterium RIFCSPHIGHO2_02_FULL_43_15]OGY61074.1 MAG: hypothetical protein A3F99_00680 [Candidatus Colwellbacteria bacterium RIFCSPLOWO2_12_FULL_43_11]
MKTILPKLKKIIKKPLFISAAVIVALLGWYFYANRDLGPTYQTAFALRGDVMEEVSVTGRVKSSDDIALSFEKSGKVTRVNVTVGNKVGLGQLLASLDSSEAQTQLTQAEADLRVQEVKIVNAEIALEESKKGLVDKIEDAYTKSDDALRTKADQIFSEPSFNPQLRFTLDDAVLKASTEKDRLTMESEMNAWKSSLVNLSSSSDLAAQVIQTKEGLNSMKNLLDKVALAINSYTLTTYPTQTTINGWRTDVSAARSNISTATTSLLTAEEKWKTADSNLVLQRAQIGSSLANVANFKTQLGKNNIYASISGIITKVDIKPGENVTVSSPVINLISINDFEVEANIPEADISKVSLGSPVQITLDAYGDEVIFKAHVASIEPAETIVEGVTTYKVRVEFSENDERIKSGMTANMDIQGKSETNVISVPQQAIVTKNGEKFVKVLKNGTPLEIRVTVGLRGANGNTTILSGLNEGDEVILSEK